MKQLWTKLLAVLLSVLTLSVIGHLQSISAQNPDLTPNQFSVNGLHSLCTIKSGVTTYCFAADGLWASLNGAAYTQIGAATAAGVTSFNGQTGAVTSATAGIKYSEISGTPTVVTSLNGKSGSLTVSATATVQ